MFLYPNPSQTQAILVSKMNVNVYFIKFHFSNRGSNTRTGKINESGPYKNGIANARVKTKDDKTRKASS